MELWAVFAGMVLVAVGIQLLPASRLSSNMRAAERVARAAAPAQAGEDWPSLYARLDGRHIGRALGSGVGMAAAGLAFLVAGDEFPDGLTPFAIVLFSSGSTIGALLGHLWKVRSSVATTRLVSLRRRELRDYLTPTELRLVQVSVLVPVLAVALGVMTTVQGGSERSLGYLQIASGLLALVVGLVARPLGRWSLTSATDVSTAGGLVWAEMLRGVLLRDVVSGLWGVATIASGAVPVFAWASGDQPAAVDVLGAVVVVLAMVVNLGFGWVSLRDTNFRWARQHAVDGVAP